MIEKITIRTYENEIQKIDSQKNNIAITWFSKNIYNNNLSILKEELNQSGVYIIQGINDEDETKNKIYVGETSQTFEKRTRESKHFWNKYENINCFYIYSTNLLDPFLKDDLQFFESNFINLFSKYKSCLENKTKGNASGHELNPLTKNDMGEKFNSIVSLIKQLQPNFFRNLEENFGFAERNNYLNISSDFLKIYPDEKINNKIGFLLNKKENSVLIPNGTKINKNVINKIPAMKKKIEWWENEGFIKNNCFTTDTWISSPSTAAKLLVGYSINGWKYWKLENKKFISSIKN